MESIADSGDHDLVEANMQAITTIGLDIAKSVFQVHVVDAEGKVVLRQQLKRARVLAFFTKLPPCLIGATHPLSRGWLRELLEEWHFIAQTRPSCW